MEVTLNIKLLRSIVLWAMGEEELVNKKYEKLKKYTWYQDEWARKEKNGACQTAFCIAGAAVSLSGYRIDWGGEVVFESVLNPGKGDVRQASAAYCYAKDNPNRRYSIEEVARDELGINTVESSRLFDGYNSIERVIDVADEIAREHGKQLFKPKHLKKMSKMRRALVAASLPSASK